MYICPKCKKALILKEKSYICEENHVYDISSSGYVNFILGNKAFHGDNKMMVKARRDFLALGKYSVIIETLTNYLKKIYTSGSPTIIDAGCGEGYYTSALKSNLPSADFFAFDVSKDAILYASKAHKQINFSVASVNTIPIQDSSADVILSLFSPLCEEEFYRILKPNGILITVSPSPNHLFGFKEKIYDTPYKNPPSTFSPTLFQKSEEFTVCEKMHLDNNNEIINLFTMTPYCYNTGEKGRARVRNLTALDTEIGFVFGIYQKLQ